MAAYSRTFVYYYTDGGHTLASQSVVANYPIIFPEYGSNNPHNPPSPSIRFQGFSGRIKITGSSLSGSILFRISGRNEFGNVVSETVSVPASASQTSTSNYSSIDSVIPLSTSTTGTVDVSLTGTSIPSVPMLMDNYISNWACSIQMNISRLSGTGTASTLSVLTTNESVFDQGQNNIGMLPVLNPSDQYLAPNFISFDSITGPTSAGTVVGEVVALSFPVAALSFRYTPPGTGTAVEVVTVSVVQQGLI